MADSSVRAAKQSFWRESGAGSIGAGIALLAGLGVDLGMALMLGADRTTDALFVGLRVPLGVAVIFPPTAIQVLVPMMTAWNERGRSHLNSLTGAAALATLALTAALAGIGALTADWTVQWLAPGLGAADHRLAAELAQWAYLMVPLVATAQVFRAYRYAQGRQAAATALQGVVGVTVFAFLLLFGDRLDVRAVVLGYVAGSGLMLLVAWLTARSAGYRLAFTRGALTEIRAVGLRSFSPMAASGVQLATRLFEQFVASFMAPGSITILAYAERLVSAVGGTLFFRPIVTVLLGRMSLRHSRGDVDGVRRLVVDGLRVLSIVSFSLLALVTLAAPPFVAGLFGIGDLTSAQSGVLGVAVAVYALSLPAAAFQRVLLAAEFARLDTATYLLNTLWGALTNVAALMVLFRVSGATWGLLVVPAAYAIAQIVNVWHADRAARRWLGSPLWPGREMVLPLSAIGLAAAGMLLARQEISTWPADYLVLEGIATAVLGTLVIWLGLNWWAPSELREALRVSRS
ncbi:MAG TPA: lipid II flippase MurJ [Acidimicrobiia bacterium]|jgi:peptidoglycan biosynthesis protein MviN/MurJ (putative lipid II flippase)